MNKKIAILGSTGSIGVQSLDVARKSGFEVTAITANTDAKKAEEQIRERQWPMGKIMNCIRLALVGSSSGLGIADIVSLIGVGEFSKRIENIKKALL